MSKTVKETIASIEEKRDEQMEMLEKWSRYQNFQMDYAIDPWEISRILLKPVGRRGVQFFLPGEGTVRRSVIVYDSYITLKDGTEHVIEGKNVKEILDGGDSSEFTGPRFHIRWK
jgi:hypothetical protein